MAEVSRLQATISQLDSRFSEVERIIVDNPSKALTLILLKKDIEAFRETHRADLDSIKREIAANADTFKIYLGLVGGILVSLLSFIIGTYARRGKAPQEGQ